MKKITEVSTKELVASPKMMNHLFDMVQKGEVEMKVSDKTVTIAQEETAYYCIFCKENGVFEDSEGYCVLCGEDNMDIAAGVVEAVR